MIMNFSSQTHIMLFPWIARFKRKLFLILLFLIYSLVSIAKPSGKDTNVIISSATETYAFEYNKKENIVKVKEQLGTTYLCKNFRTSVPIVEFYDDKSNIDNVSLHINGHNGKGVSPVFEYYSVDNIFFSDTRVCHFNLPFEKKGTLNEVYFEKTVTDPRYFTSIYFSEAYDVKTKTVNIVVPRWMNVEFKEMNFTGFKIKKKIEYNTKEDADIISYSIEDLTAREMESHSPGVSYTQPHLLVLTKSAKPSDYQINYFSTLDEQYAWYHFLTKDLGNNTDFIKLKAQEITLGISDEMQKIKKIFYWMHDNIRYIAFEDGIAGYKPMKADEVFRKKYGDCKGMAHLTKELLKSLGFDARLCWIGTNHIAYDYSTPSLAVDNHMITALFFKNKTYYLDATENYIGFNEYAERIQGRDVLIEDGEKYIHTKVPVSTFEQNLDRENSVVSIVGVNLEGTVSREWKGEEKENIFTHLNAIKKENSKDAFMTFLSDNNHGYTISNLSSSSLSNYDEPLSIKYNMNCNNAISSFGNDLYINLDRRKDLNSFIFDLKERTTDYWFTYKINSETQVELPIPNGYVVSSIPPDLKIINSDYEFSAIITNISGIIKYKKRIAIKNPRISKSKFQQWNIDVEKLKAFYNEQLVLTKK